MKNLLTQNQQSISICKAKNLSFVLESLNRKKIFRILSLLLVIVLIVEVWTVNRLSTLGGKIRELKIAKANLEIENQLLESKILEQSSLYFIEEQSYKLGFSNIKDVEYLRTENLALVH